MQQPEVKLPPPLLCSVEQIEARQPALAGRMRMWIHRADNGDPNFAWLRVCIIRVGRSVLIDEAKLLESLSRLAGAAPAPARRQRVAA